MDFKQANGRSNQAMNKNLYMTAIICTLVGLYLPSFAQLPMTLLIIGSFLTYAISNTIEFFGKRGEENE